MTCKARWYARNQHRFAEAGYALRFASRQRPPTLAAQTPHQSVRPHAHSRTTGLSHPLSIRTSQQLQHQQPRQSFLSFFVQLALVLFIIHFGRGASSGSFKLTFSSFSFSRLFFFHRHREPSFVSHINVILIFLFPGSRPYSGRIARPATDFQSIGNTWPFPSVCNDSVNSSALKKKKTRQTSQKAFPAFIKRMVLKRDARRSLSSGRAQSTTPDHQLLHVQCPSARSTKKGFGSHLPKRQCGRGKR